MTNDRDRGSVLFYVVWVIVLLSIFAASIASQTLFALDLSERLSEQLRAAYIARGGVALAALVLAHDPTSGFDPLNDPWADAGGGFFERQLAGGTVTITGDELPDGTRRYGLVDEDRRINLNAAPHEVLAHLLQDVGGMSEEDAASSAAAIEDWRDEDDDERPGGAEGIYYRSRDHGYDCQNGPFENIEELLLVKGITPSIYQRVAPAVTVYGSGRLNLNTATPTALRGLGLSSDGVAGFMAFRAGDDGKEQTADDRRLASITTLADDLNGYVGLEEINRLNAIARKGALGIASEAFRVSVQAQTSKPMSRMAVDCVIDRHGRVQQWAER